MPAFFSECRIIAFKRNVTTLTIKQKYIKIIAFHIKMM